MPLIAEESAMIVSLEQLPSVQETQRAHLALQESTAAAQRRHVRTVLTVSSPHILTRALVRTVTLVPTR